MDNLETLLVLFVGVSAFSFVLQCFAVWRASSAVRDLTHQLERKSAEMEIKLTLVQDRLLSVSEQLGPLKGIAESVRETAEEISETVRSRAEEIDRFLSELQRVGQEQAGKVDYLVSDTVQKFEQTTEVIQKDILRPVVEVSAFVKGVRSGLGVLFSHDREESQQEAEDELFI